MFNGDTSPLIVNNHQVRAHLGGFTIERERPFLPYHFIDEDIHEDTAHAVLILVTEQTGDSCSVECFRYHRFHFHFLFSLLKNAFILVVFFGSCLGSVMECIRHLATSASMSSAFAKAWFMGKSQY